MAIPETTVAIFEGDDATPFVQVAFGLFVSPVVTNVEVPPCRTFTAMVEPLYPVTGISILTGLEK